MLKPRQDLKPNTADYENLAFVKPTGFREYDARWILEKEINLLGIQALGLGLATYVHEIASRPRSSPVMTSAGIASASNRP